MSQTPSPTAIETVSVDDLAQEIRSLAWREMGAGLLAEKLMPFFERALSRRSLDTAVLSEPGIIAAAIELARLRGSSVDDEVDQQMFGSDAARVIRAYMLASPASRTPNTETVVKALQWFGNDPNQFASRGAPFEYVIRHDGDEPDEWSVSRNGKLLAYVATEEAARDFAQADFDQRIRSALASPPSPAEVTEDMVEAANKAFWARGSLPFVGLDEYGMRLRAALTAALQLGKEG